MTPSYLNFSSNARHNEHQIFNHGDRHNEHESLSTKSLNSQASLSSNSPTCHLFFNPITTHDQEEVFNGDQSHPSQNEGDKQASDETDELQFSLWERENDDHVNKETQVKWMSSKMRVMLKMKKAENSLQSTGTELKLEDHHDQKEQASSPMEETSISINISTCSNNTQSRVCSDCNTTNTPLWRSGPQGPKSLCNACGIRQRKARKAMEAARAEAPEKGKRVFNDRPKSLKATTNVNMHKVYKKPNKGHVTKYKNRQHSSYSLSPARKNCVEEFLVRLKKRLECDPVFSQEEMEAAILLMALSCD